MTDEQRTAPLEEVLLLTSQELTETAYERFVEGRVSQPELKEFYGIVSNFAKASEEVLDSMHRLGIRT